MIQSKKDDVNVQFVSLPKGQVLQRRSVSIAKQTEQYAVSTGEKSLSSARYLNARTYNTIVRELARRSQDPDFIESINEFNLDKISSPRFGGINDSPSRPSAGRAERSNLGSSSSKSNIGRIGGGIAVEESKASISGSGDGLSGYYNMSLIRYEDSSDDVTTSALYQLAGAMNRWTKVRTQVIKTPMRLDDPKLVHVPIVYIASRRPFAFSERERQNLRRFFSNGGFLMFSNVAETNNQKLEVANSIGFELWKVLGEPARDMIEIDKNSLFYNSFFSLCKSPLPDILGVTLNGRIVAIYEDSGYGNAWVSNKSGDREPYLEMGVNIIAYALTTNPNIVKAR